MNNQEIELQKASMYDLLACYYKYLDPTKHIHYYQLHLDHLRKAVSTAEVQRQQKMANVRILHAAPDLKSVDVYINAQKVLSNISFKQASTYLTLPSGKYHIDIYPSGTSVTTVISKKVTIEQGKNYTLAAVGQGEKLQLLPYADIPGVPPNEAKIRFIHLSPDTPALDIAVKGRDVVFKDVAYKQASEYLGITPMTVELEARRAGNKEAILPFPVMKFKPNRSYTIVAVGLANGEPSLEIILLKN
ncbi:DUF4397 domain-containing protein [Falsibacillus pallidus]|uniref:DUF4397 domain-containing protein n=1 Tax=Falsibacillus pallidus TaxID=493781 RepID=UPI003D98BCA6